MPTKTKPAPMAPDTILLGPVQFPANWLPQAPAIDFTQAGVVLCAEQQKHSIKIGDQTVGVKISLYVTRDAVGNEENAKVADVKEFRSKEKEKKELEQRDAHRREIKAAVDLTKQTMIETTDMMIARQKPADVATQIADAMKTITVLQTMGIGSPAKPA